MQVDHPPKEKVTLATSKVSNLEGITKIYDGSALARLM
jgi:hypothetical protein